MIVGEKAIDRCVSRLRKAAEASGNAFSVEAVPRVGYRLTITDVSVAHPAAGGGAETATNRWSHTSPYRGLAAMTEADSDYFFGRGRETVETIGALASRHNQIPVVLGNSGVGKSSLARAGVLSALMRGAWHDAAGEAGPWPAVLHESRRWCFLTITPGINPVSALVEAFLDTWRLDRISTEWPVRRREWEQKLLDGTLELGDLLDQTRRRYAELQRPEPPAFLLYIDQGEELYVRASPCPRRRFSELLARGAANPRLHILITMRSDFFGELQKDEALYNVHLPISVPPLRESGLREVVTKPAALLGVRYETDELAHDIARRAAEESTEDAGALPLLSYLLDDIWRNMVERNDGVLRLSAQTIELGRVLVDRANSYVLSHPDSESPLRRIFTLKLATVREDGEPTRRRALRSEFPEAEWQLICELAGYPYRLINLVTPEGSLQAEDTYAEVAHEAIFRRWDKLRDWIAGEREFLSWRSGLESARRSWEMTPKRAKDHALLMGFALAEARSWLGKRAGDLPDADRIFITSSHNALRRKRWRVETLTAIGVAVAVFVWIDRDNLIAYWREVTVTIPYRRSNFDPYVLTTANALKIWAGKTFQDCKRSSDSCPEMVVIPPGSFLMGSPVTEKGRSLNEGPQHLVTIAKPFAASRFEVTFAEWDACAAHSGCSSNIGDEGWGRGNRPVINVTWDDAQDYVSWLSKMTGRSYRLLSEAEYEFAARAGTVTARYWGDDAKRQCDYANGDDQSLNKLTRNELHVVECNDGYPFTAPVGSYLPNAFGLYDMLGNAWEWTQDCYHPNYKGAPADGSAWQGGKCRLPVLRGGSWGTGPYVLRSAHRQGDTESVRNYFDGFRVASTRFSWIVSRDSRSG